MEGTKKVILFYKYAPLSEDALLIAPYRDAIDELCRALHLSGRVLIGMSRNEGINGTLSGLEKDLMAFTMGLMGQNRFLGNVENISGYSEVYERGKRMLTPEHIKMLHKFWSRCKEFSLRAEVPVLVVDSPEDFKWSDVPSHTSSGGTNEGDHDVFPDLNVKLVREIIGTGGTLSSIALEETGRGYLSPEEFHERMQQINSTTHENSMHEINTVLIDCRNHKEYEIGHFVGALDPNTKTFEQFPRWVRQNRSNLDGKEVLMYCTGGIRCEKASAYIRNMTEASTVHHLKGGIHKYLERFGGDGLFRGKNFVFDRRCTECPGSYGGSGSARDLDNVVGKCLYCHCKWDVFSADGVCTVCREPTLVCPICREERREYHCNDHWHLRDCYFTDLSPFSSVELRSQLQGLANHLEGVAVGKKFKQKRRTLSKQWKRVWRRLKELKDDGSENDSPCLSAARTCRNCKCEACDGKCWGFHGLGRKETMDSASNTIPSQLSLSESSNVAGIPQYLPRLRLPSSQRKSRLRQRERDIYEIKKHGLSLPPSHYRDQETSIRCPPPFVRTLRTSVKGKWCGKPVASVLKSEFVAFSSDESMSEVMKKSLIRVNDLPIQGGHQLLKNMDSISRVIHWHEPPVLVPESIDVRKVALPHAVRDELFLCKQLLDNSKDFHVYCCNKPSTVPVHPAGPYLANSLTLMVEAQENLEPRSLLPCHRLDRATSGLTLCCTEPTVAKMIQSRIDAGCVSKLYLAKVSGKFPCSRAESEKINSPWQRSPEATASWCWHDENGDDYPASCVQVCARVETVDAMKGIRAVTENGKFSVSRFRFVSYDKHSNTSLILCCPITGRGHQLRVHLSWLGFPILDDVQYEGKSHECSSHRSAKFAGGAAIEAVLKASEASIASGILCSDNDEDAKAAMELCKCCRGPAGVAASFDPAQLLERGHLIALHALKYKITFDRKAETTKGSVHAEVLKEQLPTLELSTSFPNWANGIVEADVLWLNSPNHKV